MALLLANILLDVKFDSVFSVLSFLKLLFSRSNRATEEAIKDCLVNADKCLLTDNHHRKHHHAVDGERDPVTVVTFIIL